MCTKHQSYKQMNYLQNHELVMLITETTSLCFIPHSAHIKYLIINVTIIITANFYHYNYTDLLHIISYFLKHKYH
jgi:hypothetical protein